MTPFIFLLAEWEDENDTFGADIERFCVSLGIPRAVVRRPDDAARKGLYAAADTFVSPADNLQETFGLAGDGDFLLLWALKHDLLEFCDGNSYPCPETAGILP